MLKEEKMLEEKSKFNQELTERLASEIKRGMNRIEKNHPEDKLLQIHCNPNGKLSSILGNNNAEIRWGLDYIDVDYLTELLKDNNIEVIPSFDKEEKLININFMIDYRTEEEKLEDNQKLEAERLEQEAIERTKRTGLSIQQQEYLDKKLEPLNNYIINYLKESDNEPRPNSYTILETIKNFFQDMKKSFVELKALEQKQEEIVSSKLKPEPMIEDDNTEKSILIQEAFVEPKIEKMKLVHYDNNKTEVLSKEIINAMNRIEKNYPEELILQISCNSNAALTTCLGENGSEINRSLNAINLDLLTSLCDAQGIEVIPKFEQEELVNIDFIRDYRTKAEKIAENAKKTELLRMPSKIGLTQEELDDLKEVTVGFSNSEEKAPVKKLTLWETIADKIAKK